MTYEFQKFPRSNIVKFAPASAESPRAGSSSTKLREAAGNLPAPRPHLCAHWHVNSGTGRLEMRWHLTDDEIGLRWVVASFDRLMGMLMPRRLRTVDAI